MANDVFSKAKRDLAEIFGRIETELGRGEVVARTNAQLDSHQQSLQRDLNETVTRLQKLNEEVTAKTAEHTRLCNAVDSLRVQQAELQAQLIEMKNRLGKHEASAKLFERAFEQARGAA